MSTVMMNNSVDDSDHGFTNQETSRNINPSKNTENNSDSTSSNHTDANNNKIYGPKYVVLQNRLVEALSDLNLFEKRLLLYLSTTVRFAVKKNPDENTFFVDIKKFAKRFGIEKGKHLNGYMRKSAKKMQNKSFAYKRGEDYISVSYIYRFTHRTRTSHMFLELPSEIIKMLCDITEDTRYTYYELDQVIKMKRSNSIVLFELLAQYRKIGKRELSEKYLRERFLCTNKYKDCLYDFIRYKIQPAVDDIIKHTSYSVEFEPHEKTKPDGSVETFFLFKFHDVNKRIVKINKELAKIDFGYTTPEEIIRHNQNSVLKYNISQLKRIARRQQFYDDYTPNANSELNASIEAYVEGMANKMLVDVTFVDKHTLDYYIDLDKILR